MVCVVAYLVGVMGMIPLPGVGRWAASGEPYPCQGHRCGCSNARECLEHCCCYSPAELLAWARQRGLVKAAAEIQETFCGLRLAQESDAQSCCSETSGEAGATAVVAVAPEGEPERGEAGWGFGVSPLGCKSVKVWLLAAVPFSDLLSGRRVLPPSRLMGVRRGLAAMACDSRGLDVPVPPPRG